MPFACLYQAAKLKTIGKRIVKSVIYRILAITMPKRMCRMNKMNFAAVFECLYLLRIYLLR